MGAVNLHNSITYLSIFLIFVLRWSDIVALTCNVEEDPECVVNLGTCYRRATLHYIILHNMTLYYITLH